MLQHVPACFHPGIWQGTVVALKAMSLPGVLSADERRQQMALMEAAISSSLAHPNIVQVGRETVCGLAGVCMWVTSSSMWVTSTWDHGGGHQQRRGAPQHRAGEGIGCVRLNTGAYLVFGLHRRPAFPAPSSGYYTGGPQLKASSRKTCNVARPTPVSVISRQDTLSPQHQKRQLLC